MGRVNKMAQYTMDNINIVNTTLYEYVLAEPESVTIVTYDSESGSIYSSKKFTADKPSVVKDFFWITWNPEYEPPCYCKIFIVNNFGLIAKTQLLCLTYSNTWDEASIDETDEEQKRAIASIDNWANINLLLQAAGKLEDDDAIIYIKDRKIEFDETKSYYTLINEDNISEVLTFRMAQYYEGIDLSEKDIYFYCNPVAMGTNNYIKLLATEVQIVKDTTVLGKEESPADAIEFKLIVNNLITDEPGPVSFAIVAEGPAPSTYFWQTYPATLQIDQGVIRPNLKVSDYNIIDYNAWQKSVEQRLAEQNTWYSLEEIISTEEA
jgi:hypothetical protein